MLPNACEDCARCSWAVGAERNDSWRLDLLDDWELDIVDQSMCIFCEVLLEAYEPDVSLPGD